MKRVQPQQVIDDLCLLSQAMGLASMSATDVDNVKRFAATRRKLDKAIAIVRVEYYNIADALCLEDE
jgi:hypothetical protein